MSGSILHTISCTIFIQASSLTFEQRPNLRTLVPSNVFSGSCHVLPLPAPLGSHLCPQRSPPDSVAPNMVVCPRQRVLGGLSDQAHAPRPRSARVRPGGKLWRHVRHRLRLSGVNLGVQRHHRHGADAAAHHVRRSGNLVNVQKEIGKDPAQRSSLCDARCPGVRGECGDCHYGCPGAGILQFPDNVAVYGREYE